MRFRNGRKSFGLIAVLSCVLTASVAFAAYTGYNYINGTVEIVGNPFKMVYATSDGTTLEDGGTIPAVGHATTRVRHTASMTPVTDDDVTNGIVSDISVQPFDSSKNSQTIDSFTVKMAEFGALTEYTFNVKNVGGAAAYPTNLAIAGFDMPTDAEGTPVTGVYYVAELLPPDSDRAIAMAQSHNGGQDDQQARYAYAVNAGETLTVHLRVNASSDSLFSAVDADGNYGAEIALGQVTITWSAVPPA